MDFRRIELIFLFVFCGLNLFLYTSYKNSVTETMTPETNLSTTLEKRLANDNISYSGNFSTEQQSGYYLTGEQSNLFSKVNQLKNQSYKIEENKLVGTFYTSEEVTVKSKDSKKKFGDFIKKPENIISGSSYTFSEKASQVDGQLVYVENWEGIPFNDDTAKLTLLVTEDSHKNMTLTGYEQEHIENIEPLREKQDLISERDAIITLYMNMKLPAESKIKWTQLAYTRIFTAQNKNVYIPVWFVAIQTNKSSVQVERVNAFTNTILSSSVSDVKK